MKPKRAKSQDEIIAALQKTLKQCKVSSLDAWHGLIFLYDEEGNQACSFDRLTPTKVYGKGVKL